MSGSDNKTKPTEISPADFVEEVEHPVRKADAERLLDLFGKITGLSPRMWGPSLIGYGEYHYEYETGREGDFMMTGFSPRKANLVVYIMPGYTDRSEMLARLGKHKMGKSCLYINKLADINMDVLEEIISDGFAEMKDKYPDWKA